MTIQARFLVAAVAAVWLCASGSAGAVERQGWIWGLSIGGGTITCDSCDSLGSVGGSGHVGGMLNERIAVLAEGYVLSHPEKRATLSSVIGAAALQLWASDAFWVKGGVGFGQLQVDEGRRSLRSESAVAILAGAGYEIVRKEAFAVDLQGRFGTIFFNDGSVNSFSGHIGFNWY